jgi:glutamate dehydrogenase (NAD(P)+)
VVQGFGNAGSTSALALRNLGARIIGLSHVDSGLYDPRGFDVQRVVDHVAKSGTMKGFGKATKNQEVRELSVEQILETECDILIPAAVENVLTAQSVSKVKAKMVVEAANGPTTAAADEELEQRGVVVVPDILANAGGLVVSYLELLQNRSGTFWERKKVLADLEATMTSAFEAVVAARARHAVSYRKAAYTVALERMREVVSIRGSYQGRSDEDSQP